MTPSDQRRQRQLEEIRALCARGAVGRAIDLGFEHLACFGPDDDVVVLLEAAVATIDSSDPVHRRLLDLRAVQG